MQEKEVMQVRNSKHSHIQPTMNKFNSFSAKTGTSVFMITI